MRVKEWEDGALVLDGDLDAGIDEAFQSGRYVEAFALLHGLIDWLMASLYQLEIVFSGKATSQDAWRLIEGKQYGYLDSAKFLRESRILTDAEYDRLLKFNGIRNKIVHRLIRRHFQTRREPRTRITKKEADDGFEEGKELVALLRKKSEKYARIALGHPQVHDLSS